MDVTSSAVVRRETAITLAGALAACLAVEICLFAWFGVVNRDEGWYLNAGRFVFQGKIPYRDFNYYQSPLLPYLYGLPQTLFGPGLLVGRMTSVAFLACAIVALAKSARIMAGDGAVTWTLALLAVNPTLLYYGSLARSESATLLFCALALWCFVRYRGGLPALVLAPGCLLLAVGVREPLLPAAAIAIAYICWRTPAQRSQRCIAAAILLAELVAIGVPAILGSDHVVFNLWSSQTGRGSEWNVTAWTVQTRIQWPYAVFTEFALLIVPLVVLYAVAVAAYTGGWRPAWRHPEDEPLAAYLLISTFGLLTFAPFVVAILFEPRYFVPTSGLLAVVAGCAISSEGWRRSGVVSGRFLPSLIVVVGGIVAPFYVAHAQGLAVPRGPEAQLRGAGDAIRSNMGPGDQLLAFDPLLVLDSGVRGTPGFEMGQFSYWPRMDTASATGHGVFNRELLIREITMARPKVVALTDFDLNFFIGSTTQRQQAAPTPYMPLPLIVLPELAARYGLRQTIAGYGENHENLWIFVRNP